MMSCSTLKNDDLDVESHDDDEDKPIHDWQRIKNAKLYVAKLL